MIKIQSGYKKDNIMIKIGNIRTLDPKFNGKQYLIVRSLKNPIKYAEQMIELSPSKQLFFDYLKWKKKGIWNEVTFKEQYLPRFLHELKNNSKAIQDLKRLIELDKNSEDVRLVCFCTDANMCHRRIIASILAENGANVVTDTKLDKYGLFL